MHESLMHEKSNIILHLSCTYKALQGFSLALLTYELLNNNIMALSWIFSLSLDKV